MRLILSYSRFSSNSLGVHSLFSLLFPNSEQHHWNRRNCSFSLQPITVVSQFYDASIFSKRLHALISTHTLSHTAIYKQTKRLLWAASMHVYYVAKRSDYVLNIYSIVCSQIVYILCRAHTITNVYTYVLISYNRITDGKLVRCTRWWRWSTATKIG